MDAPPRTTANRCDISVPLRLQASKGSTRARSLWRSAPAHSGELHPSWLRHAEQSEADPFVCGEGHALLDPPEEESAARSGSVFLNHQANDTRTIVKSQQRKTSRTVPAVDSAFPGARASKLNGRRAPRCNSMMEESDQHYLLSIP